jgi:hypothetical protein
MNCHFRYILLRILPTWLIPRDIIDDTSLPWFQHIPGMGSRIPRLARRLVRYSSQRTLLRGRIARENWPGRGAAVGFRWSERMACSRGTRGRHHLERWYFRRARVRTLPVPARRANDPTILDMVLLAHRGGCMRAKIPGSVSGISVATRTRGFDAGVHHYVASDVGHFTSACMGSVLGTVKARSNYLRNNRRGDVGERARRVAAFQVRRKARGERRKQALGIRSPSRFSRRGRSCV